VNECCCVQVRRRWTSLVRGLKVTPMKTKMTCWCVLRLRVQNRHSAVLLWSPYVIGQTIIFSSCFFLLFFPRLISAAADLPCFYTCRGPSANLECRSEMCCSRLAANTGRKKVAKNRHLGTIAQLRRAISS